MRFFLEGRRIFRISDGINDLEQRLETLLSARVYDQSIVCRISNLSSEYVRIMIQLHQCLALTCQYAPFQLQFFSNTILLQEVLQEFLLYALSQSSKTFFDDLSVELGSSGSKHASLIFLFRCIEAPEVSLPTKGMMCERCVLSMFLFISTFFTIKAFILLFGPSSMPRRFVVDSSMPRRFVEVMSYLDVRESQLSLIE